MQKSKVTFGLDPTADTLGVCSLTHQCGSVPVARERKADTRSSRTRRKRRARVEKSERLAAVPLQYRAAFANYLLHGMTPAQARLRVCAEMAEAQEL